MAIELASKVEHNAGAPYVVHSGQKSIACATTCEVWDTIDELPFGALYEVTSPTGHDVEEFVPY